MAFQKKTWQNRISAYPNRRTLTKTDGTAETVTVARDEGDVTQEGDELDADNLNDLEERIRTAVASSDSAAAAAQGTADTAVTNAATAQSTANAAQGTANTATTNISKILGDFATVEPGSTASKAYAVGDYLVKDGYFYRVTAAIAQGDTLTVDGNIVKTNVGAELAKKTYLRQVSLSGKTDANGYIAIPGIPSSAIPVAFIGSLGSLDVVVFTDGSGSSGYQQYAYFINKKSANVAGTVVYIDGVINN